MGEQRAAYWTSPVGHWCPEHAGGFLEHCWHSSNVGEFHPAGQDVTERVQEQCCWCAGRRWRDPRAPLPGLHGPHVPEGAAPP